MHLFLPNSAPLLLIAFSSLWVAGCASWKETPSSGPLAPTAAAGASHHENKRRLELDVEFVNIRPPEEDSDSSTSIWQWVDETAIDADLRRKLLSNGIRVGLVANDQRFRQRLADVTIEKDVVETFLSHASVASDVSHGSKSIPMRFGRRYELPLHQPIEGSHVALLRLGDETVGKTLNNAQYLLAVTATQGKSQQQVELLFRPEIQHGDARQKWVSSDKAIRIDTRRDTWPIPELDLNITASESDTLVLSATTPATGLAKRMLTGTGSDSETQQLVLLVRVARIPSAVDQL